MERSPARHRRFQVISKPGREELEQALSRAMNSTLDAQGRLRLVNSALDALAAEVRSRASLDRVACIYDCSRHRRARVGWIRVNSSGFLSTPATSYQLACTV